jgi:hypothetical protein
MKTQADFALPPPDRPEKNATRKYLIGYPLGSFSRHRRDTIDTAMWSKNRPSSVPINPTVPSGIVLHLKIGDHREKSGHSGFLGLITEGASCREWTANPRSPPDTAWSTRVIQLNSDREPTEYFRLWRQYIVTDAKTIGQDCP